MIFSARCHLNISTKNNTDQNAISNEQLYKDSFKYFQIDIV